MLILKLLSWGNFLSLIIIHVSMWNMYSSALNNLWIEETSPKRFKIDSIKCGKVLLLHFCNIVSHSIDTIGIARESLGQDSVKRILTYNDVRIARDH